MLLIERKPPESKAALIGAISATAVVYFLTARLGLLMAIQDGVVTAVWPPSGVALAALLIFSKRVWPGIWIGSFAANLWPLLEGANSPGGWVGTMAAVVMATGSLGAAWFAVWAFKRLLQTSVALGSVRRVAGFLFLGGVLGCLISSLVGATTLCVISHAQMDAWLRIWLTWWMGDALGVCLFAPALLAWSDRKPNSTPARPRELLLCLVALLALCLFVFTSAMPRFFGGMTDDFILLPMIVWAALRHGYRGATMGMVIVGVIAIWGTAAGYGPFIRPGLTEPFLCLDLFLFCLAITALTIAAVVTERAITEVALATANQSLESRVAARTKELERVAEELKTTIGEQTTTLNALRESQTRLTLATSSSKIGYWDWNIRTGELKISPEWLSQIGFRHDDSLNLSSSRAWKERLHPDDVEDVMSRTNEHLQTRDKDYTAEFRFRHKDGSYRDIYSRGRCMLDSAGKPERMIGCHVDVTELRTAEKSANLLRTMSDKVNDCIEIIDPKSGKFLDANSRWFEEHGYTREEMLNLTVLDVDSKLDQEEFQRNLASFRDNGGRVFESEHRRKDGSVFPVELSISYVKKDRDYLVVVMRNISERKRVEDELKNSEDRFKHALDATNDGIWDWDITTGAVYFSKQWGRLLGYEPDEVPQRVEFFFTILHPDHADRVKLLVEEHLAGRTFAKQDEVLLKMKTGDYRWFLDRGKVVKRDAVGKPLRMVGTITDIHEKKNTEKRIAAFANLARKLATTETVRDASQHITSLADDLMGWDAAVLVMLDEANGQCRSVLSIDTVEGRRVDVPSDLDDRPPTPQMQKVIKNGAELILRSDLTCTPQGFKTFGNSGRRSASLMYVPIRDGQKSVGMLSIQSYTPNAYTYSDLATLEKIADQCAATLSRIRIRMEQRENQERLALSTQAANIGYWDWNTVTNVAEFSAVWQGQLGYAPGEIDGEFETWKALLHPDDREKTVAMASDYIKGRSQEYKTEVRMRHKDGTYRWILTQGKLLKNHEGKYHRMVGCHVDITDRKASELEKAHFASLLHATIESSEDGVLVVDSTNKVTLYNQRFAEMWRIPKDALATKDDLVLLNFVLSQLDSPEEFLAGVHKLYATPEATSFDTLLFKDGRIFERYSHPQKIADSVVGRVWNFRDVSERKRLESSLRLTQFSVDRAVDAVYWVASDGEILYVNDTACRTLGYSREELVGKIIPDIDPNFPDGAWAKHWAEIKERKSFTLEANQQAKDGHLIKTEVTVNYLEFEGREYNFATTRDITERKRAEETLQLMQFGVDRAGDSVFWVARDGRITYVNEIGWKSRGYTREEMLGMTVFDLDPNFPREVWGAHWDDLKNRGTMTLETRHRRKDGSLFFIEVNANHVSFGANEFNCAFVRDITERKRAEEALRASEQQFAELVNNIDGIVWEGDAQTLATTFVSYQAERILGYSLKDWLGSETFWQDHIYPDDRQNAVAYCCSQIQLGRPLDFEYRMISADGRVVWMRDLVVVTSKFGKPTTMRGIMVDITERKKAEQALRASEQHYKSLFDSAPDAVFVVGLEPEERGRILAANHAAAHMHGFTIEELTSMTIFQLDAPTAVDNSKERMKRLLAGERQSFEIEHYRKDGTVFPLEVTAELMEVENKKYILAFDRDITERKINEVLLSDQKRILELIASGSSLKQALIELCLAIEHQCSGTRCAIMLADNDGLHLHSAVAPNIPDEYSEGVNGLAIGPCGGSCGTAAHRGETVIVEDITIDPLWAQFAELGTRHGFRSCWSTPIFARDRQLIGTFAVYRDVPSRPSQRDIATVNSATHTAAIAIQKQQADEELARSREVLRQLSLNLFEAQETERRHLARELHDEVGQTLTATKILLEGFKQQTTRVPIEGAIQEGITNTAAPLFASAVQNVEHLLKMVRNLSLNLRPPMLDDFGLVSALRWLLDQHSKTTGRIVELDANYQIDCPDPTIETACFRTAQEALTNVTRHAQAKKVSITIRNDPDGILLVVADDGVGFSVASAQKKARDGESLGLISMQERAGLVGGSMEIISSLGKGTEVRAHFPLAMQPVNVTS